MQGDIEANPDPAVAAAMAKAGSTQTNTQLYK
jgi:hypothetical protein